MESINPKLFDIVIPIGPNDINIYKKQIEYTKKNIIGYRNIFLIIFDARIKVDGCITISETLFPFSKTDVEKYHGPTMRCGWYLQQLFKLYSGIVIPDILDKYLVIDSDTLFLKPTTFIENNKMLFNISTEYHEPYFVHMYLLHKSLLKQIDYASGICHHMIFQTDCIKQLFELIENEHNDKFCNVFLKLIQPCDYEHSGSSEYEIYFNYMIKYHRDKIDIRILTWDTLDNIENLSEYEKGNNQYITSHWYCR
jgi:hypothetical protein